MNDADQTRGLTLLNEMGDVEITWDSAHDDEMRQVIEKKMKEGVKFFIIKPLIGSMFLRRTKLSRMSDLKTYRVSIKDEDIEAMFSAGKVALFRRDSGEKIDTVKMATSADEVVTSRSMAVPQFRGG